MKIGKNPYNKAWLNGGLKIYNNMGAMSASSMALWLFGYYIFDLVSKCIPKWHE